MTTCRSCDAEVVFVPSATSGKSMILDATPAKGVVVMLEEDMLGSTGPLYEFAPPAQPRAVARVVNVYTDHHVSCPEAAAWKGKHR